MTNKEKYIDNASNENLVKFLIEVNLDRCNICSKKRDCQKIYRECIDSDCEKGIKEWLSQEVSND